MRKSPIFVNVSVCLSCVKRYMLLISDVVVKVVLLSLSRGRDLSATSRPYDKLTLYPGSPLFWNFWKPGNVGKFG